MAFAPFRDFLALVILDGDVDLPQHQLAGLADVRSKGGDGLRGVEIKDWLLYTSGTQRLDLRKGQRRSVHVLAGANRGF